MVLLLPSWARAPTLPRLCQHCSPAPTPQHPNHQPPLASAQARQRRTKCTATAGGSEPLSSQPDRAHTPAAVAAQQQEAAFAQLLARVQRLSFGELQQLAEERSSEGDGACFSSGFLFWLAAQERRAAPGPDKAALASLAAQLVLLSEQRSAEDARRALPPLASSLAYSNLARWQAEHEGASLPEVVPGISIPDLYKAAEREEAKLAQWTSPRRPASSLDGFARSSGYQQFAADAMARVRARLQGWEDDASLAACDGVATADSSMQPGGQAAAVSPAAVRVLDALLLGCCCREERATLLPEAFVAPGLEVPAADAAGSSHSSSSSSSSSSTDGTGPMRMLTSPQRLLAAIAQRRQAVEAEAPQQPPGSVGAQEQRQQQLLPSGESLAQALAELAEDVADYDQHVFSRLSQRDRLGL